MKQCSKCKVVKDLEFFHRCSNIKDGYKSACKTCRAEERRHHYENNKERVLKQTAAWQKENRDRMAEYYKTYSKKNPDKMAAKWAARHASKLQRTVAWSDQERIQSRYTLAKYLEELDGRKRHVDHVIPLRGELVSGLHVHDNLQILLAEDNLSKSNNYEVL